MSPELLNALAVLGGVAAATVAVIAVVRKLRGASGRVRRATCDMCSAYAPVMNGTYHQNTGMLVMRRHRQAGGTFCRGCHFRVFWRLTLHTFFLGWWGTISLVLTPLFLLNNVGLFLASQTLPGGEKVALDLLEEKRAYALNLLATKPLVTVVEVLVRDTGATQEQVLEWVEKLKQAG
ncbi:MAG TPA: hypothetical protein VIG99_23315 [Myxococcaceae bacterium]|jgi:hypothetical protein